MHFTRTNNLKQLYSSWVGIIIAKNHRRHYCHCHRPSGPLQTKLKAACIQLQKKSTKFGHANSPITRVKQQRPIYFNGCGTALSYLVFVFMRQ
jgi:hypothetical protein